MSYFRQQVVRSTPLLPDDDLDWLAGIREANCRIRGLVLTAWDFLSNRK